MARAAVHRRPAAGRRRLRPRSRPAPARVRVCPGFFPRAGGSGPIAEGRADRASTPRSRSRGYNPPVEYSPGNVAPRILSRAEHNVSRKNIDDDALKVLYRLKNHGFVAYLVGGGVRDLLLERQPKDFDIGTSAHPQQVKKLFRNCFIVGRRFRLCHVRFGRKVVEVSTFRRQAPRRGGRHADPPRQHLRHAGGGRLPPRLHGERALLRHRDLLGDRLGGRPSTTSRSA